MTTEIPQQEKQDETTEYPILAWIPETFITFNGQLIETYRIAWIQQSETITSILLSEGQMPSFQLN